jgi:hypothetical protein
MEIRGSGNIRRGAELGMVCEQSPEPQRSKACNLSRLNEFGRSFYHIAVGESSSKRVSHVSGTDKGLHRHTYKFIRSQSHGADECFQLHFESVGVSQRLIDPSSSKFTLRKSDSCPFDHSIPTLEPRKLFNECYVTNLLGSKA